MKFKIDNKMLIKILIVIGAAILIFFLGSMVNSWLLLAIAIIGFLIFLGLSLQKDVKIVELSNKAMDNYLNGEESSYRGVASYVQGEKDIAGVFVVSPTKICFISQPEKGDQTKIELSINDIKEIPESNYLRLDTWQGMFLFKTEETKIIKDLLKSKGIKVFENNDPSFLDEVMQKPEEDMEILPDNQIETQEDNNQK